MLCPTKHGHNMHIETERLVIRDLQHKDAERLHKIVWQDDVVRFMGDWSQNRPTAEAFRGYIDWHQTQKRGLSRQGLRPGSSVGTF